MKTADLIASLAANAEPAPPIRAGLRLALAVVLGAAVTFALLVEWLGMRPLHEAMRSGSFWMKAAYTVALSAAGLIAVHRLGHPGRRLGAAPAIVAVAIAVMLLLSVLEMLRAAPAAHAALWLGKSWRACSLHVVALAAPVFVAVIVVLRRLAPTRPAMAGAAAGLLAGALGATVYGFYCTETAAPFVMTWYTLGIAACAGVGALVGARWLRW